MTSIREDEEDEEDDKKIDNLVTTADISLGYPVGHKDVEISAAQCIPFEW